MTAPHVLVVSGVMGVGKTSVTEAVGDLLAERDLPSAMIDLDWLGQLHPMPPDDPFAHGVIADNLAAVWPSFAARGVKYLALARLVTAETQWSRYRAAIPDGDFTLVRLVAPIPAVEARLDVRHALDVSASILDYHRSRVADVTATLDALALEDFTVVNEDRPLRDVAEEVLGRWLG
ncbi:MAG TPA: hypothetical protein VNB94_01225 [Mycobacteriales bacterium]|nr:hypothetical protein [Mycobacteriales bacterium]